MFPKTIKQGISQSFNLINKEFAIFLIFFITVTVLSAGTVALTSFWSDQGFYNSNTSIKDEIVKKTSITSGNNFIQSNNLRFVVEESKLIVSVEGNIQKSICAFDVQLLNTSEAVQILPGADFVLSSKGEILPMEQGLLLSGMNILNPTQTYILHPSFSLNGYLVFDCTRADDIINLTPIMFFEDEFQIGTGKNSLSYPKSEMTIQTPDTQLPVEIVVQSFLLDNSNDTRFCELKGTIRNQWDNPLMYESFHLSLLDSTNSPRPRAKIYTPNQPVFIQPYNQLFFHYLFNCQDNGENYTLKYQPYQFFNEFVTEEFQTVDLRI